MSRRTSPRASLLALAAAAVGLSALPAVASPGEAPSPAPPSVAADRGGLPGRWIVTLADGVDPRGVAAAHARAGGLRADRLYAAALTGFAAEADHAAVARLRRDPRVLRVEADLPVRAMVDQTGATWGLDRIDQSALPLDGTYRYDSTASTVTAYVVDSGVRPHRELDGRLLPGATAVSDGRGTDDCNGHGTHVAATMAGTTYGVAKALRVVPVRVLDCQGSGSISAVIAGLDWVASQTARPAVVNLSLGGGASTSLDDAVKRVIGTGMTVAVAAGNSNADACGVSPARVPAALTVGATTSADARASYSNWGSCLDLFAPGSSITSAGIASWTATSTMSGTSMASPHVAGVAALHLAADPSLSPAAVASRITGSATSGVVTSTGRRSPNLLLRAPGVVATTSGSAVNTAPTAVATVSCSGGTCTFDASGSTDDVGVTSHVWSAAGWSASGAVVTRAFSAAGEYPTTVEVADSAGATSSATVTVRCTTATKGKKTTTSCA